MGLAVEDVVPHELAVFPENRDAVLVFADMGTQWRWNNNHVKGLDYNVLPFVMTMRGISQHAWPAIYEKVLIMEDVAIAEINRQIQEQAKNTVALFKRG